VRQFSLFSNFRDQNDFHTDLLNFFPPHIDCVVGPVIYANIVYAFTFLNVLN